VVRLRQYNCTLRNLASSILQDNEFSIWSAFRDGDRSLGAALVRRLGRHLAFCCHTCQRQNKAIVDSNFVHGGATWRTRRNTASSLILPHCPVMWKHDVSHKTGSTELSDRIVVRGCLSHGHSSFVRYCNQRSSLLWTSALRPYSGQCACPGREGELVGVCDVCVTRGESGLSRSAQLVEYF